MPVGTLNLILVELEGCKIDFDSSRRGGQGKRHKRGRDFMKIIKIDLTVLTSGKRMRQISICFRLI
jgi:hypothetical protein